MIGLRRLAVWAAAIFMALIFVYTGVTKLTGESAARWAERFARWGYPASAHYFVGVFEVISGVLMLVPRWRRAAAAALGALMIGAFVTHVVNAEFDRVIPPLVLGALAFLMCLRHRP